MAESLPSIEERLQAEGIEIVRVSAKPGSVDDGHRTQQVVRERSPAWVVLDGYRFDSEYQKLLKQTARRLLVIDDFGRAGQYFANLVLDQNLGTEDAYYSHRAPYSRLLLGTAYIVLRRPFRVWKGHRVNAPRSAHHVLITFGGIDKHNVTLVAVKALRRISTGSVEARIVVGSGNPQADAVQSLVQSLGHQFQVERDPEDMAELMAWADLAVAAAGTTAWELAYMGVPSLLVSTADNQMAVAQNLELAGAATSLGESGSLTEESLAGAITHLIEDGAERESMSRKARALVDGHGVSKVLTEMRAAQVTLRRVQTEDARVLWTWRNDPLVRSVSFNEGPIPWDDHLKWFEAKENDPSCAFYVGLDDAGVPIGQIRFDQEGSEAEVSTSIDAKARGHGYGSGLILAGSRKLFGESRIRLLHAYVKPGNQASVRAFLKAGYRDAGRAMIRGHKALHFVLEREVPA